jgi:2-aminobenzoate-CoA ligase
MQEFLAVSAHVDSFTRDNLPPRDTWPEFRFDLPELRYAPVLNCAEALLDRWAVGGQNSIWHDRRPSGDA